jgi:hypothetical protein
MEDVSLQEIEAIMQGGLETEATAAPAAAASAKAPAAPETKKDADVAAAPAAAPTRKFSIKGAKDEDKYFDLDKPEDIERIKRMLPSAYRSRQELAEAKALRDEAARLKAQQAMPTAEERQPLFGDDPIAKDVAELKQWRLRWEAEQAAKMEAENLAAINAELGELLKTNAYSALNSKLGHRLIGAAIDELLAEDKAANIERPTSEYLTAAVERALPELQEERSRLQAEWEAANKPKPKPAAKVGGLPNSGTSLSDPKDQYKNEQEREAADIAAIERILYAA